MEDKSAISNKIWNHYFILVLFASIFLNTCMQFFTATLSLYIVSLGGNASLAGVALVSFTVTAVGFKLFLGYAADTRGKRVIVIFGCTFMAIATVLFNLFPFLIAIIILRGLQGIGYSAGQAGCGAIAADVLPKERMGEGIGYYNLALSVASAFGPLVALAMIEDGSYHDVFNTATLALVIAIVCIYFCNYEKKRQKPVSVGKKAELVVLVDSQGRPYTGVWKYIEKKALPAAGIQLVLYMVAGFMISYVPLFADTFSNPYAGLFFTFSAAATFCSRLVSGKLFDRFGGMKVIFPAGTIGMIGFLVMPLSANIHIILLASAVLYGIGLGIIQPILNATALMRSPKNRSGVASATYLLSLDLGFGLAGLIWGIVIDVAGFSPAIYGCAGLFVAVMVMSFFLFSKGNKQEQEI